MWKKESEAKKPEMKMYLDAVRAMEKYFKGFTVIHIPRSQNDEADKLAKAAARKEPLPRTFSTRKSQNPPQNKKKQNKSTSYQAKIGDHQSWHTSGDTSSLRMKRKEKECFKGQEATPCPKVNSTSLEWLPPGSSA